MAKPAESVAAKPARSAGPAWRVRRARPSDGAAIAALGAAAFARGWSRASIAAELASPDGEAWALASPDPARAIDGFLLARRVPGAGAGGIEVLLLAVREELRRRGGASALLGALLQEARRAGLGWIQLDVRAQNRAAIDLYLRHGFAVVGRRPRYYEAREDAILMSLALEEV